MGGRTGTGHVHLIPKQYGSAILEVQVEDLSKHLVSLHGESLLFGIEWTKKYSVKVLRGIVQNNNPMLIGKTVPPSYHANPGAFSVIIRPHQSLVMAYNGDRLKPGQKTFVSYTPSESADDAIRSLIRENHFFTKLFHAPDPDAEVIRHIPEQGTITGYCRQITPLNL